MDKRILAALALVAVSGFAQAASTAVCGGATQATNGTTISSSTDGFVKVDLTPKCSANVNMAYDQTGTTFGVCSNSVKGKNNFGGSTEGGGVTQKSACAAGGYTAPTAAAAGCSGAAGT